VCGSVEREIRFPASQAPPAGYEIKCEWGERRDGTVGSGPYFWTRGGDFGEPRATRWDARRDAIAHAATKK
jgi:hypothetical protein